MASRAAQPKIRRSNKFALILLAVLILTMGIMLRNMNDQLRYAQLEQELYARQLAVLQEKNDKLAEDIQNSGSRELIEDIARNELGMASYGEKIFRFQS